MDMRADIESLLDMNSKCIESVAGKKGKRGDLKEIAAENKVLLGEEKRFAVEKDGMLAENNLLKKKLEKMEFGLNFVLFVWLGSCFLSNVVFSK